MEVVRAVYEDGALRPMDPIPLASGQEVELVIVRVSDVRRALGDLLGPPPITDDFSDIGQLEQELAVLTVGASPASDLIIAERMTGP